MTAKSIFNDKSLWAKSISNIELDMLSKKLKLTNYRGAISRDQLPQFPVKKRESFILNLQKAGDGNGSHWVGLIKDGNKVFYFDSYGGPQPNDVCNRYPDLRVISSTFIAQNTNDDVYCGILSLYVIYYYWKRGRDFFDICVKIKKAYDLSN